MIGIIIGVLLIIVLCLLAVYMGLTIGRELAKDPIDDLLEWLIAFDKALKKRKNKNGDLVQFPDNKQKKGGSNDYNSSKNRIL